MRGRFWVAALVIGALSFFGVRGIVQQIFEEDLTGARTAMQDIVVKAETAIALASDATAKAKATAERAQSDIEAIRRDVAATQKQLAAYTETLAEIEKRADTVNISFQEIQLSIAEVDAGATTLTEGSIQALLERVKEIESTVAGMAESVDYVTATGESVALAQAKLVSETGRRLNDVKAKSAFSVWMWVVHVDEAHGSRIVEKIKELGFPIATRDIGSSFNVFNNLPWDKEDDIDAIEAGTVIIRVASDAPENTVAYANEIRAALATSTDPPVVVVRDPDTSPHGVVVTVKPQT